MQAKQIEFVRNACERGALEKSVAVFKATGAYKARLVDWINSITNDGEVQPSPYEWWGHDGIRATITAALTSATMIKPESAERAIQRWVVDAASYREEDQTSMPLLMIPDRPKAETHEAKKKRAQRAKKSAAVLKKEKEIEALKAKEKAEEDKRKAAAKKEKDACRKLLNGINDAAKLKQVAAYLKRLSKASTPIVDADDTDDTDDTDE